MWQIFTRVFKKKKLWSVGSEDWAIPGDLQWEKEASPDKEWRVQAKWWGRETGGLCRAGATREVPHTISSKRERWHWPREQAYDLGEPARPQVWPCSFANALSWADTPTIKEIILWSLNREMGCLLQALWNNKVLFKRLMLIFYPPTPPRDDLATPAISSSSK